MCWAPSPAPNPPPPDQAPRPAPGFVRGPSPAPQPIEPLPTYQAPAILALPEVEGDPSNGAVVYKANCVMCHGDQGQGRFGLALAKAWPVNDPPTYIRQVVGQGIDGSTMPAWSQANGGPLTDQKIR